MLLASLSFNWYHLALLLAGESDLASVPSAPRLAISVFDKECLIPHPKCFSFTASYY